MIDATRRGRQRNLERRLRELAELQLDLSNALLAFAERHARNHDELEELADDLYAAEQELLAAITRTREGAE